MSTPLATSGIATGTASGGAEKLAGLIKPMIDNSLAQVRGEIERVTMATVEIRKTQERSDATNQAMHKEMMIKMNELSMETRVGQTEMQAMLAEIANQHAQILSELKAIASAQSIASQTIAASAPRSQLMHVKVGGGDECLGHSIHRAHPDNSRLLDDSIPEVMMLKSTAETRKAKDVGAADRVEFLKNLRIVHVTDLPANMFQKNDNYIPD